MKRVVVSLLIGTLCLAACGPGDLETPGPADPGATAAPAGMGTVSVRLVEAPPVAETLSFRVVLDRTSAPAQAAVVDHEEPYGGAFESLYTAFVDPGTYTVTVELVDPDGAAVLTGSQPGVPVLAGKITPVSILLEPTGGVQVVAGFEPAGTVWHETAKNTFDLPFSSSGGLAYLMFAGTQRVVAGTGGAGKNELVALAVLDDDGHWDEDVTVPLLYRASTATELLNMSPIKGTPISIGRPFSLKTTSASIAPMGSDLLLVLQENPTTVTQTFTIYRSGDWENFEAITTVDPWRPYLKLGVSSKERMSWYGCGILVDNQLNLFCRVARFADEWPLGGTVYSRRFEHLVHAFGPDLWTWTDLPPLDPGAADAHAGTSTDPWPAASFPDYTNGFLVRGPTVGTIKDPTSPQILWNGATYRAWVMSSSYSMHTALSLDRNHWMDVREVKYRYPSGTVSWFPKNARGFAVFRGSEAPELIWVDSAGVRHLAVAVE